MEETVLGHRPTVASTVLTQTLFTPGSRIIYYAQLNGRIVIVCI